MQLKRIKNKICCSNGEIKTLDERCDMDILKFALKASTSERFGSKWFTRHLADRTARPSTRRFYLERRATNEREKNNPIQYMTRILNEQHLKNVNIT